MCLPRCRGAVAQMQMTERGQQMGREGNKHIRAYAGKLCPSPAMAGEGRARGGWVECLQAGGAGRLGSGGKTRTHVQSSQPPAGTHSHTRSRAESFQGPS